MISRILNKNFLLISVTKVLFIILPVLFFLSCNQKVSVTPPDSPPPNGYVFISSKPEGFQIYLDGNARRRSTPDSITWLKTGTYQITLKKNLFKDSTFYINIIEGKKLSIFIDYSKSPAYLGGIKCITNPANAQIFINDSSTNFRTPHTFNSLLPNIYKIRYHLYNHWDLLDTVIVTSGNISLSNVTMVDTTLWKQYTTYNSSIRSDNLTCALVDKKNIVWIGTDNDGVMSFDGKTWTHYAPFSLPDNHINCISMDANGLIFIGTNRGFVTFDGTNWKVYGFQTSGLQDFYINAISFDNNGNWFIGTRGGLTKSYVENGIRNWFTWTTDVIPDPWITSLMFNNKGHIWAGLKNSGIAINGENNYWKIINYDNSNILSNNVTALAQGPDGIVWIGFDKIALSGFGITYYSDSTWTRVNPLPQQRKTNAIVIDRMNTKWIATDQGLLSFPNPTNIIQYSYENTGLNMNDVTGLTLDPRGYLWITTRGNGLIKHKLGY